MGNIKALLTFIAVLLFVMLIRPVIAPDAQGNGIVDMNIVRVNGSTQLVGYQRVKVVD